MNEDLVIPDNERRYPPRAIADAWSVNVRTVHRWIADGLPADNIGSTQRPDYRIKPGDVSAYLWQRQRADAVSSDA
jgi:hypothetical protein